MECFPKIQAVIVMKLFQGASGIFFILKQNSAPIIEKDFHQDISEVEQRKFPTIVFREVFDVASEGKSFIYAL